MPRLSPVLARFDALPGPVRAGFWMSLSALCYAVSGAVVRHLSHDIPTFQLVFMRDVFALMFLTPWLMRTGFSAMSPRRLGLHGARGFASLINVSCQFGALAFIPVADMAAISFLQPIFGSVIAIVALGEALSGRRWTAVALGFAGALLIIRPGFETVNVGILLALASAFAGSIIAILIKYMLRTETPDAIAAYLFIFQTGFALIPAIIVWRAPTLEQFLWMAVLGWLSLWLQRTFNRAMAAADATVALPFNFSRLIWAALLGWIVFAELPDVWTWIGAALVFIASVYVARSAGGRKLAKPGDRT